MYPHPDLYRGHPTPRLGMLVWPLVPGAATVVIPVGSVEQHGPHLPLTTDTVIAEAVAAGVVAALSASETRGSAKSAHVLLAPAIGYGASGEHQDFPGTASIGTAALQLLVVELVRSVSTWGSGVVLVNGHGGNAEALTEAADRLRGEGRSVFVCGCVAPGADLHAGRTETSLMMHLAPDLVRVADASAGPVESADALLPLLRAGGVASVSPTGVLGDPTGATPREGQQLYQHMVRRIVRQLAGRLHPGGQGP